MGNNYFKFKQFIVCQDKTAFKVGTDGVLLGAIADFSGSETILDVGTGTGLIAIMAAQRTDADIVAIEPDEDSFIQASENIKQSRWYDRISVINTDFRNFCLSENKKFDTIITNPPFFRNSLKNPDSVKSAARHSDSLTSGEILEGSCRLLGDEGSLQLILPYVEGNLFIAEAQEFGFYCNRIIKIKAVPSGEIKRLVLKFERIKKTLSEKFLTIETGTRHQYTEEYKKITREFYLNF
jgi:tRNA1Val (adenine37-N6)-methyltransferase